MLSLERVALHDVPWERLDRMSDRVLFQTRPWLDFVAETRNAEPVVAVLRDAGEEVGWFTGLVCSPLGLRVLGAPMPGWATQYQGFNLLPGISRREAIAALPAFAFDELHCSHFEVCDRNASVTDVAVLGGKHDDVPTFTVDLRPDLDQVLARMKPGTRQNMRKADRCGVVVEDADPAGFAGDYYAQLQDVFAKQRLAPSYPLSRVESLVRHLHPTGLLQLIRVRAPDGTSVATGLIVGLGSTAYFWGGASWREHQHLRPNEVLFRHAFTTWVGRGATEFDFGGGGEYKRKYGAIELTVPHVRLSRWRALEHLRGAAKRSVAVRQRVQNAVPHLARS